MSEEKVKGRKGIEGFLTAEMTKAVERCLENWGDAGWELAAAVRKANEVASVVRAQAYPDQRDSTVGWSIKSCFEAWKITARAWTKAAQALEKRITSEELGKERKG